MKEEKTQGINTETTATDSHNTNKKTKETELLDLRAGYFQHTSPLQPNTARILNVLIHISLGEAVERTSKGTINSRPCCELC